MTIRVTDQLDSATDTARAEEVARAFARMGLASHEDRALYLQWAQEREPDAKADYRVDISNRSGETG